MNVHPTHTVGHKPQGERDHCHTWLNVPDDAGRYRDALTLVLLRIPSGYGQRIACGPGWYPLISKLHKRLCGIDIDYAVYGVASSGEALEYDAECQSDDPTVQNSFYSAVAEAREQSRTISELV